MSFDLYFGPEHLRPALLAALLSVSLLIGLFAYLNSYTRRRYFQIWMVAWLFHALWLCLTCGLLEHPSALGSLARTWAVGISALFLSWGCLVFMGRSIPRRVVGLLVLFLALWSYVGTYHLDNPWHAQFPVFATLGVSSLLAARCFFSCRMRQEFAGATLLCAGFACWGGFLLAFPFAEMVSDLRAAVFVVATLLQLFIAVGMIVLVLEEARQLRRAAVDNSTLERGARAAAEGRLRSTEARYRQLFDQASEAIVITSCDGFEILELNLRARQLLGVSGELTPKSSLNDFLRRTNMPRSKAETQCLDRMLPDAPMNLTSRDGGTSAVAVRRSVIEMDGEPAYQFVLKEMTERFQLEQQIRQAEKLSALGQMISGIAHELNNPLAVIKGYLDLLLSRADVPMSMRGDLEKIAREGNRAAKLVRNFLSFARERPAQRGPVPLNELIESVVELGRFDALVAQSTITLDLDPGLPQVIADADQVQQVLVNLLHNSLQALACAPCPGRIVIRTRAVAAFVSIQIEDNGPGVPADLRGKIFEPFFTTKEVGVGTGLGLSIAHSIMSEHGGRITYTPAPTGGAGFTLEFPVPTETITTSEPAVPEPLAPLPAPFVAEQTGRVLVLDDEETLAEMVGEILTQFGHQVVVTSHPLQALDLLRRERFDVILSDYRMPQLDGRGFHAEVQRIDSELASRIIFLTGDVVSDETRAFFESVGNPRLAKPFQLETVARTVNDLLVSAAA